MLDGRPTTSSQATAVVDVGAAFMPEWVVADQVAAWSP